jgi:2,4-dienoyl-CoA reductase-like NADH-dependent reductase (Old Yellow Enzyme family)
MTAFSHLAQPLAGPRLRLKNRVVHPAILTLLVQEQMVSDAFLRYHANRAKGGAAMIVVEPVNALSWQSRRATQLNVYDDSALTGLTRLADEVHRHDCRLLAQIQDRGRGNYSRARPDITYGASALPDDESGAVPYPLSADEVAEMIAAFAAAARHLENAGFDGVELSSAHGHLFHQFLSPHSNHRQDRYGGDFPSRLRLLEELIAAIRDACGPEFVIGLKLPADDGIKGGIDLSEAKRITAALADPETVDFMAFAWGSQSNTLHWHVPDGHWPRMPYVRQISELREVAEGIPVMALGRIVDPNEAEAVLAANQADLVGIGRAMITDPAWTRKALSGRSYAIRPCVSCNTCWGSVATPTAIACDNNPALATANEIDGVPMLSNGFRRVVVVGGGVAGLEAAWVASARGHEVTLFSASGTLGGRARLAAALPGAEGLAGVYDYQTEEARSRGVSIELGVRAEAADISGLAPDHIILASGARMAWPEDLMGIEADFSEIPNLPSAIADLLAHPGRYSGTAVVIDEDHGSFTYNAIDWLSQHFDRVVLLTSRDSVARHEHRVARQGIIERLLGRGVEIQPFRLPDLRTGELEDGMVGHRQAIGDGPRQIIEDVSFLSYAAHREPRLELLPPLRAAGHQPRLIGDARAPRTLLHATREGYAAGLEIS